MQEVASKAFTCSMSHPQERFSACFSAFLVDLGQILQRSTDQRCLVRCQQITYHPILVAPIGTIVALMPNANYQAPRQNNSVQDKT